jgi:hypothetical protein
MESGIWQQLILNLLEPGIYKTTAQVVEEFRMEHPAEWQQLKKEGEMLYGKSCSSVQQPSTRIAQTLLSLPAGQCLRHRKNNQDYWSIKSHD